MHIYVTLYTSIFYFLGSVFLEKEQDVHAAFRFGVETLKARHLLNETEIEFDIQYASPHDFFHLYTRGKDAIFILHHQERK